MRKDELVALKGIINPGLRVDESWPVPLHRDEKASREREFSIVVTI